MISLICNITFLLAQNETEKDMTILGVTLFGAFIFFLILDSIIKGKWIPKKGPLRGFLIFLFSMAVIAIILLIIFYK